MIVKSGNGGSGSTKIYRKKIVSVVNSLSHAKGKATTQPKKLKQSKVAGEVGNDFKSLQMPEIFKSQEHAAQASNSQPHQRPLRHKKASMPEQVELVSHFMSSQMAQNNSQEQLTRYKRSQQQHVTMHDQQSHMMMVPQDSRQQLNQKRNLLYIEEQKQQSPFNTISTNQELLRSQELLENLKSPGSSYQRQSSMANIRTNQAQTILFGSPQQQQLQRHEVKKQLLQSNMRSDKNHSSFIISNLPLSSINPLVNRDHRLSGKIARNQSITSINGGSFLGNQSINQSQSKHISGGEDGGHGDLQDMLARPVFDHSQLEDVYLPLPLQKPSNAKLGKKSTLKQEMIASQNVAKRHQNPSSVYQWLLHQQHSSSSAYNIPSIEHTPQQVKQKLKKEEEAGSKMPMLGSISLEKVIVGKRRSVQNTPERKKLPDVSPSTTKLLPSDHQGVTDKMSTGGSAYDKFFIRLDKHRKLKQSFASQNNRSVITKTPNSKQVPNIHSNDFRQGVNLSVEPNYTQLDTISKQIEFQKRLRDGNVVKKMDKAQRMQNKHLMQTQLHEDTLSPMYKNSKKFKENTIPAAPANTDIKLSTNYDPKQHTMGVGIRPDLQQNFRYNKNETQPSESLETSYLFPFIGKQLTKSSRNIHSTIKNNNNNQTDTFEAYVGYVTKDGKFEAQAQAPSKGGDYDSESKHGGSIGSNLENIQISTQSYPLSMYKSHDASSSRQPTAQASQTVGNPRRKNFQSSNQSVKKCDILLSEDSEAPQRLAAPGNLAFNTASKQNEKKRQDSGDIDRQRRRKKLLKKLEKLNLYEVVQEQRHRHPELNEISTEKLNQLIIQEIISLKENQAHSRSSSYHKRDQLFDSSLDPQSVGGDYSLPEAKPGKNHRQNAAQIINHYNITINHSSEQRPTDAGNNGSNLGKFSLNEVQQIMLARDQALQQAVRQQPSGDNDKQTTFMYRRGTDVMVQQQEVVNPQKMMFSIEPKSRESTHSELKFFHLKQPRVKRRPALDTNLVAAQSNASKNQSLGAKPQNPGHNKSTIPKSPKQVQSLTTQQYKASSLTSKEPSVAVVKKEAASVPASNNQIQVQQPALQRENTLKRRPTKTSELKTIVAPKVDFTSLIEPNCAQIASANKNCLKHRQQIEDSSGENEEEYCREYSTLDLLIITFEGVLGAFVPPLPQPNKSKEPAMDTLVLRPGIKEALLELLKNFKVVIITGDSSTLRQKALLKKLNQEGVPYDAVYQTMSSDNFFIHCTIQQDLKSNKLQVLFVTATLFSHKSLSEQAKKTLSEAQPRKDFQLLPIAVSMERFVVVCMTHLLVEAGLSEVSEIDFAQAKVCEMTSISSTISNFYMMANTFTRNELILEQRERKLKEAERKQNQGKLARQLVKLRDSADLPPENIERIKSTTESVAVTKAKVTARRTLKVSESQASIKEPPKQLSQFEMLTSLTENAENLYPISFFQRKVEDQRTRDTFIKAFERGQNYDLYTFNYCQPDHLSREILSCRLEDSVMLLRSKILKIKQAMRIIAQKEANADEKSFRVSQKNYELQRKQPAFVAFQKYNSHYFSDIYDECNVRLPCHPSREQFEKLQSIYKSLQSRLDNLVNNTFPFSIETHKNYNLMLFDGHLHNQVPLIEAAKVERRQYQLKDQYQQQTQSFMNDLHRNFVKQNTALTITSVNNNDSEAQQSAANDPNKSSSTQVHKLAKDVPDIISWLSERQPTFSAANALPKASKVVDETSKK